MPERSPNQEIACRLLSLHSLASTLGVRKSTLKERLEQLRVPVYHVGRHPRYLMSEVLEALKSPPGKPSSLTISYDQTDQSPPTPIKGGGL